MHGCVFRACDPAPEHSMNHTYGRSAMMASIPICASHVAPTKSRSSSILSLRFFCGQNSVHSLAKQLRSRAAAVTMSRSNCTTIQPHDRRLTTPRPSRRLAPRREKKNDTRAMARAFLVRARASLASRIFDRVKKMRSIVASERLRFARDALDRRATDARLTPRDRRRRLDSVESPATSKSSSRTSRRCASS